MTQLLKPSVTPLGKTYTTYRGVSYLSDTCSLFPTNKVSQMCLWWVQKKNLFRWIWDSCVFGHWVCCESVPFDEAAADRLVCCSFTRALFPNLHVECGGRRENPALQLSLLLPCSVVYIKCNTDTLVPRYNYSVPLNVKHWGTKVT